MGIVRARDDSCNNATQRRGHDGQVKQSEQEDPSCARQRRPDVRRHATLPQSWIQQENWEFETHRAKIARMTCAVTGAVHHGRRRRTTMSRSAARESRQRQRLCETCRQRKARYRFRGGVRADRQHTLCFACFRSLRDRHHAQSRVDLPALRSPFRPPLTPRQIAHRRAMLVHLETLNTTAPPRQGTLRCG